MRRDEQHTAILIDAQLIKQAHRQQSPFPLFQ